MSYIPQKKAQFMYNSFFERKNRIFEDFFLFKIFVENIKGRQKYPKGGPFYAKIKDFKKNFFFF